MASDSSLLVQMRQVSVEQLLLPLLIQLVLILSAARVLGWLFRRLGQPAVVGEIAAGLVLGPSILGQLAPEVFAAVFRPALPGLSVEASDLLLSRILTALSQIGLVLLLFLVGLEFDFRHLRWNGKVTLTIALAGLVFPFALGAGLGYGLHGLLAPHVPILGFVLLLGTAIAITAIPVLGQIMVELGIARSRLAAITITAAALEDACGWILLAAVAALARAHFDPAHTVGMIAGAAGFTFFLIVLARPLLSRFAQKAVEAGGGELSTNGLTATLVLLFLCAVVTNVIGVFAVFGAFLFGAVLSGEPTFRDAANRRLRGFVTSFFLPIFFAYTGLRANIGTLDGTTVGLAAAAVIVVAILGKVGGCSLAAWLGGCAPREAACVGVMMNTRGLMELVVANVGKDLGVIPDSVYCMLVLMALVTTFMTTPLLLRLARGTELEACMARSGFQGDGIPPVTRLSAFSRPSPAAAPARRPDR